MKCCTSCNKHYETAIAVCPFCRSSPVIIDGFPCYSPRLAHDGGGFDSVFFSELARLEDENYWFQSRNNIILWALEKYCPDLTSLLEIGVGTGYVMAGIAKRFPRAQLWGGEVFTAGLGFAATRSPAVNFMQIDARQIPFVNEFDVVGAFDVLEHIKEDAQVLCQVHNVLRTGGCLLLTVPQHTWLWSPVDDYACHERRYSARKLHKKVRDAGFEIVRSTSFVTGLLPVMFVSRLLQKYSRREKRDVTAELKVSPLINRILKTILAMEFHPIRLGANYPAGGSRLLIARKL